MSSITYQDQMTNACKSQVIYTAKDTISTLISVEDKIFDLPALNEMNTNTPRKVFNEGRWSNEERRKFYEGIIKYTSSWVDIQQHVGTRSSNQLRSFSQKIFYKLKINSRVKDEFGCVYIEEDEMIDEFERLLKVVGITTEYIDLYEQEKAKIIGRLKYLNKQNFKVEVSSKIKGYFGYKTTQNKKNEKFSFLGRFQTKKRVVNNNYIYNEEFQANKNDDFSELYNNGLDHEFYKKPQIVYSPDKYHDSNDDLASLTKGLSNSTAFKTSDNSTFYLNSLNSFESFSMTFKDSIIVNSENLDPTIIKTIIPVVPKPNCYEDLKSLFLKTYPKNKIKKKKPKKLKVNKFLYNFHDEIQFESILLLNDIESSNDSKPSFVTEINNINVCYSEIDNNSIRHINKSPNSFCPYSPEYTPQYNNLSFPNDVSAYKSTDSNPLSIFQDLKYNNWYEYKYNIDETNINNYINFKELLSERNSRIANSSKYNDDVYSNKSNDLQQNIFSNDKNSDKDSCKSISIDVKNFFV